MSKTKLALDVVTDLRNLAGSIETLVFALESNQTDSVAPAEKKETKENKESKKSAKPPKAKLQLWRMSEPNLQHFLRRENRYR